MDTIGPLPKEATFTTSGGKVLLHISGSAYRDSTLAGRIGVRVKVDGVERDQVRGYTNEKGSHKALVADSTLVSGLAPGTHTVRLEEIDNDQGNFCGGGSELSNVDTCTTTDSQDFFTVGVTEIPG
jgi:hypothetical protein